MPAFYVSKSMRKGLQLFVIILLFNACQNALAIEDSLTVSEAMDNGITRLYNDVPAAKYGTIDDVLC